MAFPAFAASSPQDIVPLAVLAGICLVAAWLDVRYRRIPNLLCAAAAIAGLVAAVAFPSETGANSYAVQVLGGQAPHMTFGHALHLLGNHALHILVALVGGMFLFRFGIVGGGDAKFYAGVAAWFAFNKGVLLFVSVALCGLVLLIFWFTYRRIRGYPIRRSGGSVFDGLPYGLAIGSGALAAYLL